MKVPFYSLEWQHQKIREEALNLMAQVYDSNWYLLGNQLKRFEKEFAAFCSSKYCAGVSNGLDALYLSLLALDIGHGDEVIVPAHTFVATWLAVSRTGARPVPVDVDTKTLNITAATIEPAITYRTKAIVCVHLYGQACVMDEIMLLGQTRGVIIIEDNAQAIGSSYKNQKTGSFGSINATSFYPSKNLGALGNGGAITTSDQELYQKVEKLRNYGSVEKYQHDELGVNSRLDEIQASLLALKLPFVQQWNNERRRLAGIYKTLLTPNQNVKLPQVAPGCDHVYHLFVIECEKRNELQQHLLGRGIQTLIHYPIPCYRQRAYRSLNLNPKHFPVTERISTDGLSLPIWPGMDEQLLHYICDSIQEFYDTQLRH